MALYSWLTLPAGESLLDTLPEMLGNLGFEVCQEASTDQQIYAIEPAEKGTLQSSRVNVTVSWACSSKTKYQIEVRSSEPMFKRNTRCEKLATALRDCLPPSK